MTSSSTDLAGRVALITGGGRGIGRATSLALAARGAAVAVNWARDEQSALNTVKEIRERGGAAAAVQARVDNIGDTEAMVEQVSTKLGPISILVHNGGIASRGQSVADTGVDEVERLLRVHAIGPHQLTRFVLPTMRRCPRGDIVMISSVATHLMEAGGAPYSMGKAALEALAYTVAKEEADNGIHINIVAPGLVASEMGDRMIAARTQGAATRAAELDQESPFGHVCRPDEIADVVTFLVSPAAGYLTGQRVVVDGGANPHRP